MNKNEKDYEKIVEKIDQLDREIFYIKANLNAKNNYKKEKKSLYRKFVDKFLPEGSKKKMILRLGIDMLRHPIRACSLFFKIKHRNIHYGDHIIDILYLREGKLVFKNEKEPMVSIVIPVFNQIKYTYKCLKSILKNSQDVSYEIIIGDDVSSDGTKFISSYVKGINVVRNEINLCFLKNCNNAARIAKGKYVLFLNNDTEVCEGWLSSLVDLIEKDETIGMVGSKLVYPDGSLQEAGGVIHNDGTACNYGNTGDPLRADFNYVRDVDYISGASIMIDKKLWDKIGGFDEYFAPAYCEDSDLAFQVRKNGYRVVYQPKSVVIHYEGVSNGSDVNNTSSLKHYQLENMKKLREKWVNELKSLPFANQSKDLISYRDRINGKKVVLYVDHYVPEFDKDAGSRTTFQYIKMLVNKGYLVKFLPDNFNDNQPYTSILEQMGVEVLYGLYYQDRIKKWILENKNNIDIVYFNRPHITAKYIDFIKENTEIKIIYYGHDLHFLREMREYEVTGDELHKEESEKWKKIELDIMRKSDVVYYPSYIEEEAIHKIDKKINVKAITAYIFDNIDTKTTFDFNSKKGILFVGGFRHRPNVDGVLWFANNVYPIIRKKLNIPFYIVGSNAPKEIKKLGKRSGIIVKGFVSDEELKELYSNTKMVVAPLRYGAGIKGKIVEAMYNGIPVVTTSIGAEGIKDAEKIMKIADDQEDFAEKVLNLYNDEKELQKMSLDSRKNISKYFNQEAAWKIIEEDFDPVIDCIIVTPDGYGSKGDEAMIRGALNVYNEYEKILLLSPRNDLWTNRLNDFDSKIREVFYPIKDFTNVNVKCKNLIVLGADLIDGTQSVDDSIYRLKLAGKMAREGSNAYVFCSFRSDVKDEIIKVINELPNSVKFYLRDELSIENFNKLTNKKGEYFPDMAYFAQVSSTTRTDDIIALLESQKKNKKIVGINCSETSFRSLYGEVTIENKRDYVRKIINAFDRETRNEYLFVLICHDVRHWEGYYCDNDFSELIEELFDEYGISNYFVLDPEISYCELLKVIPYFDTVITGRMHLSITSFRSGVIPIIYTGLGKKSNYTMIDKMRGMSINRIGTAEFVTTNQDELKEAIEKIRKNDLSELKKKLDNNNKKDQKELEDFRKQMRK